MQDLAEVFLFLPLQDAQEVVELRHAEGVPLQGERGVKAAAGMAKPASPPQRRPEHPGPTWGFLTSGSCPMVCARTPTKAV